MPINSESTPPPVIGKIGPYTVFMTPPSTPKPSSEPVLVHSPTATTTTTKILPPPPQIQNPPPPSKTLSDASLVGFFRNAASPSATGRFASVYSDVQNSRMGHTLPLPSVLKSPFKIVGGPQSSAAGKPDEIAKLFPNLCGQPSAMLVPSGSDTVQPDHKLKIGVVLSDGQAPGGHNVISGIFDYLQDRAKGSTLYGFRGGPASIMKCKYVELTSDYIYPYRNQVYFLSFKFLEL